MLVEVDGTVALSIEAAVRFSRPSIDVLMESAAWVYRERMLAILLSGANDDGMRGLAAVRAAGGETWAQSPETAASPQMPQAAIESGAVNEVLDPNMMPGDSLPGRNCNPNDDAMAQSPVNILIVDDIVHNITALEALRRARRGAAGGGLGHGGARPAAQARGRACHSRRQHAWQ